MRVTNTEDLLTPKEAAQILDVTERTVSNMIRRGELRHGENKKGGKTYYTVTRADVEALAEARRQIVEPQ
jgi:excisionase family DNA binding protein